VQAARSHSCEDTAVFSSQPPPVPSFRAGQLVE